jgi:hypothetical protein
VTAEPLPSSAPPSPDSVIEQAVATGDEHAIKLTEACLRLHAESPDPVLFPWVDSPGSFRRIVREFLARG